MAGPYQPNQGTDPYPSQPPPYPMGYGMAPPPQPPYPSMGYPGALPPPVPYPKRRRGRLIAAALAVLAVVAAALVAVVLVTRAAPAGDAGSITPASAKQAIQGYLDALSKGDIETISRNTLCGLYDGVRDRRTDDALARLSSDAFQKQFSKAEVTSVDTIVFASPDSAQVLFTMKVAPTAGGRGGGGVERQAVAQLLAHDNHVLVCSYVQRTAGTF